MSDLDELMAESMKDPAFAAAYRDAESRTNLMDTLVMLRVNSGLSIDEVAVHMGVKPKRVRDYERRRIDPHWSTHQRYARALGHRLTWAIAVERPGAEEENPSA